ncbi:MAG: hypothetical protein PWP67_1445 [Clostridium butyricum]|jgi:hypothetical protein|nr:MAG: hypothetical protein Q607_CBUC00212G0059 [Clostridium butyricum DORA_1]MDK2828639.1 hypothetical protein [Clostridium butyricum]
MDTFIDFVIYSYLYLKIQCAENDFKITVIAKGEDVLMKTWEIMIGFQALTALISLMTVLIFMFKKDELS